MKLRYGYSMITVPLRRVERDVVLAGYRRRRRQGMSRFDARESAIDAALYSCVSNHPEFATRRLRSAPELQGKAS